jgi:hypothetical protein
VSYGTAALSDDPEKQKQVFLDKYPELSGKDLLTLLEPWELLTGSVGSKMGFPAFG